MTSKRPWFVSSSERVNLKSHCPSHGTIEISDCVAASRHPVHGVLCMRRCHSDTPLRDRDRLIPMYLFNVSPVTFTQAGDSVVGFEQARLVSEKIRTNRKPMLAEECPLLRSLLHSKIYFTPGWNHFRLNFLTQLEHELRERNCQLKLG